MASLNKVLLMGNLTRDVELRFTPSGMALATMGLAINHKYRDTKTNEMREDVTFVDVEVWGKQAESAKQYLSKGRPVFIEGRLKLDQWEDKQTGQKRSKLKISAERIQFLGGGQGEGGGARSTTAAPRGGNPAKHGNTHREEEQQPPLDDLSSENVPF